MVQAYQQHMEEDIRENVLQVALNQKVGVVLMNRAYIMLQWDGLVTW